MLTNNEISTAQNKYISFKVTGKYYMKNKRFSVIYTDFRTAMSINLWNGSVWGVTSTGKTKLIKRVNN